MPHSRNLPIRTYTCNRPYLTLTALLVVVALVIEALVWQVDSGLKASVESHLLEEASDTRAVLEAEINEGIYITIGINSFIQSREGDVPLDDVRQWMATLFQYTRHLRNIGLAPNNRIEAVFPPEGNEGVLGLDYRTIPAQWPAVEAMMQSGEASLVGPINLVQGGVALIYRRPVFIQGEYWGLISTVMNLDSILAVLKHSAEDSPSYYRIRTLQNGVFETIAGGLAPSANQVSRSLLMDMPGNYSWELTMSEPRAVWPMWTARLTLWTLSLLLMLYGWQRYKTRRAQLQASREKIDFLHTISHELRTPLTSVSGALALLERETNNSPASERLITMANRNAKRLERLVSEVLDIARLDSSRMSFKLEPLIIGPVLQQAMENIGSLGQTHDVTIQFNNDSEAYKATVQADEQRLLQVMDNLLSNAIKFSDPGQSIDLRVKELSGQLEVSVQDYGIGIPEHFQSRLFERFARVDHSDARRNQSGTGLGLSIARDLARHMGGDIKVRSTVGKGSCFTLSLPKHIAS